MKTFRLFLISLIGYTLVSQVQANDLEIALGSETAQVIFRSDSSLIGWGGADLALGVFYNEESDVLGQASLLQVRQASEKTPLTLGVGIKTYLGRLPDIDANILALGIGGEIRYTFPGVMPKSIYLAGFFAPKITSYVDAEMVLDYVFGFQVEVLPQTTAFIGVRHFEVDTEIVSDYELDEDNVHVGVRLTF